MSGEKSIVNFLRKKDYEFVKVLGQGACGKTVLLRDDVIGSNFVCKKYVPCIESRRHELFKNFLREIKLLHEIHHANVVRVFNYYVYPEQLTGYILMEYIDGVDVGKYLREKPETVNDIFLQAIDGFAYLEKASILHRDIRPFNILVRGDGALKIIDLGFGKFVEEPSDFDKSISINWWCEPPDEFFDETYNHSTEVYFVGRLFEKLIVELNLEDFKYKSTLARMCQKNPEQRISSFFDVKSDIHLQGAANIEFHHQERLAYLAFADRVTQHVTQIESGAAYKDDVDAIRVQLENAYRNCMLENSFPNCNSVLSALIDGGYWCRTNGFPTQIVKSFIDLLRTTTAAKQRIILANIHSRLDAVKRYTAPNDDDIPF